MPLLQIKHKKIHYSEFAKQDDPSSTFVLIHGLGSTQNYYAALATYLAKLVPSARILALDTTGQGRSPNTGYEQSIDALATDIIEVMDALRVSKAIVVGHSMAGITVPHLAATHPDRVEATVLLGPVYPNKEAAPTFNARIEAVERDGMQAMADTVPSGAVAASASPLVRAFIRELLMATDPAGYVSMCRVIVGAADAVPAYGQISCPVLILAGDEDKSAPVSGCERILNELGGGRKELQVLESTGHWMALETPEECARRMAEFVGAGGGSGSSRVSSKA